MKAFFQAELAEILNEGNKSVTDEQRSEAKQFFDDCRGAADGEMDILFQETGRGYYAHLHELRTLKDDEGAYAVYRDKLLGEINAAEKDQSVTDQMKVVREQMGK